MVKVLGTACGLGVQGSGWVAGDGLVVTNAHVVAGPGRHDRRSSAARAPHQDAEAIWFDPRNDLAMLRVPGPGRRARAAARTDNAAQGTSAAILGFPENGPYDVRAGAARAAPPTVLTQDAYGRGPGAARDHVAARAVRSGNSGGPVVDASGRVVATIFAASVSDGGGPASACPTRSSRRARTRAAGPVDTGPCVR